MYTAVISKGSTQSTEIFTVGLQTGSGDIDINTTKLEYHPGDSILILGDTGTNVLLTLTLTDPDVKEIKVKDALGREWQLGTLQADLNLPERFDISYVGEDGAKHRPVMLHRALFGSLERFIGTMIEFYAGKFPLWLAPVQAMVASITGDAENYAYEVRDALKKEGYLRD